jgi:glycosyltransferase involved in cell wall biosynthesis
VYVSGSAVDPAGFEAIEPSGYASATILYVGQLEERKGIAELLDAVSQLRHTAARLRVVGNGSLGEEVRRRAAELGNVDVVGYVPQADLPGEMARATCLVLPSVTTRRDREPWGMVVNEAMHAGLPVVASTAVGAAAAGLVRDGHNGFVVPERDVAALAGALERLSADPALARRMGKAARRDVGAFTHARMAEAFEAAVEHAVSAGRARGRDQRIRRPISSVP